MAKVLTDATLTLDIHAGESATYVHVLGTHAAYSVQLTLQEGARVQWFTLLFGGSATYTFHSSCRGAAARSDVVCVFAARNKDCQELSITNNFEATDGQGEVLMKGIAEESAHVSCRGMIAIGPHAHGTNTYLTQDVLMLDTTAKIDAVPGLEIKTNDVKASHSATVSRVSPEDLFYFASRGIGKQEARAMYIEGFLKSAWDSVENTDMHDQMTQTLETYLERR